MDNNMEMSKEKAEELLKQSVRTATKVDKTKNGEERDFFDLEKTEKEQQQIESLLSLPSTAELQLTKEQTIQLRTRSGRNLAHLLINKEKTFGDSDEMKAVKNSVADVERFLLDRRNETMTPELIEDMRVSYNLAIAACQYYCDVKKPSTRSGVARKEMVSRMMENLRLEMNELNVCLELNEIKEGMTLAQYAGLENVRVAEGEKKTEKKKNPVEMTPTTKKMCYILNMIEDPKKLLVKKKDTEPQSPYLKLRDELRSFPAGKVCVKNINFNGMDVRLMQKSDSSLYIIQGSEQLPLEMTADLIADRIETHIMENAEEYGKNNVAGMVESLDKAFDTMSMAESLRVRNLCVHFLEKLAAGQLSASELSNVSTKAVLGLVKQAMSESGLYLDEIKEAIQYCEDDGQQINILENIELLKSDETKKAEEKVSIKKQEKKVNTEQTAGTKEWTEEEDAAKEFMADLIYSSETWMTDETRSEPGLRIRKILEKHTGILAKMVADLYRLDTAKPSIIEGMLDKLPVNQFGEDAVKIKETLKEKIKQITDFIDKKIEDGIQEKYPNDGSSFEFVRNLKVNAARAAAAIGKRTALTVESFIKDMLAEPTEEMKNGLIDLEKQVDEATDSFMDEVQATFTKASKGILDKSNDTEKKDEKKEESDEEKEGEEVNKKDAKALEKILDEAATSDKGQGGFIKTVFANYFKSVGMLDKRSMFASALRNMKPSSLDANSTEQQEKMELGQYLGGLLKGAGPLLQKMLQGMAGATLPPELQTAVDDMRSNLAPIPDEIIKAQLLGMVERSKGTVTKIDVEKSLGSASVGQALLCRMYGPSLPKEGKEVVVKLLKPDVRNRMMREKDIMLKCAKESGEGMFHTYEGQLNTILEEMDLTIEAKNCEAGSVYDGKFANIKSMKVNKLIEPTMNAMVLEKAEGTTVDRYIKDVKGFIESSLKKYYVYQRDPNTKELLRDENGNPKVKLDLEDKPVLGFNLENIKELDGIRVKLKEELERLYKRREHLLNVAELWVTEGIYKAGFYHGDLHAGNMMINDEGATLIDFGNVTRLAEDQQKEIMRMLAAVASGDGEGFLEGFHKLLANTPEKDYQDKRQELLDTFNDIMSYGDAKAAGQRIAVCLVKAQELGFELPPVVANFSAGQIRIQNTIQEMNKLIESVRNAFASIDKTSVDASLRYNNVDLDYIVQEDAAIDGVHLAQKAQETMETLGIVNEKEMSKALHKTGKKAEQEFAEKYNMKRFKVEYDEQEIDKLVDQMKEFKKLDPTMDATKRIKKDFVSSTQKKFNNSFIQTKAVNAVKKAMDNPDLAPELLAKLKIQLKDVQSQAANVQNLYDRCRKVRMDNSVSEEEKTRIEKEFMSAYDMMNSDVYNIPVIGMLGDRLSRSMDKELQAKQLERWFQDKENYGDEMRASFENYQKVKDSGASDDEAEEAMKEFLQYYRVAFINHLKTLGKNSKDFIDYVNNRDREKALEDTTFPDVMGKVIMGNKIETIKKLGLSGIKYVPKLM